MGVAEWVAIVGIPIGVSQLWMSRRQGRASFEQTFVARYWQLNDDQLLGRVSSHAHASRYLRLCEDQFELMRLGQISWATWEIWHDGIRAELGRSGVVPADEYALTSACWLGEHGHSGLECESVFGRQMHAVRRSKASPARNLLRLRRWMRTVGTVR